MATVTSIVIDAERPSVVARFWAGALDGYEIRAYDDEEIARLAALGRTPETDPTVAIDGPGPVIFVQESSDPKRHRNRVHLDLVATSRADEVERLRALGARVRDVHPDWTVTLDPAGNEFCVVDPK